MIENYERDEDKKKSISKMVHSREISTTELKGNKGFIIFKEMSDFTLSHFLEI